MSVFHDAGWGVVAVLAGLLLCAMQLGLTMRKDGSPGRRAGMSKRRRNGRQRQIAVAQYRFDRSAREGASRPPGIARKRAIGLALLPGGER